MQQQQRYRENRIRLCRGPRLKRELIDEERNKAGVPPKTGEGVEGQ